MPAISTLESTERYWEIFSELLEAGPVTGSLVMDGALAALAIEHGATLCTVDRDFRRFGGLNLLNPLTDSPT